MHVAPFKHGLGEQGEAANVFFIKPVDETHEFL
jgi:hypothetical protein